MKKVESLISGETANARILLSSKEASAVLGISVSAFTRLRLPKVIFGRRCRRYRMADVVDLINRRLVKQRGGS